MGCACLNPAPQRDAPGVTAAGEGPADITRAGVEKRGMGQVQNRTAPGAATKKGGISGPILGAFSKGGYTEGVRFLPPLPTGHLFSRLQCTSRRKPCGDGPTFCTPTWKPIAARFWSTWTRRMCGFTKTEELGTCLREPTASRGSPGPYRAVFREVTRAQI